jgi:hypothetical protein
MGEQARYSMNVGNIGQQEIDLLECLVRIDTGHALDPRSDEMLERLVEAGLVDRSDDGIRLTLAGIERCQSLQHRVAGDKEAAKVLAARDLSLAESATG